MWPPVLRLIVLHDAVLPLLAWFIPHAEWKMNEPLYPDCAKVWQILGPSLRPTLIFLPKRWDCLEFPRVASLFPSPVQRPFRCDDICVTTTTNKILFHSLHSTTPGLKNGKRFVQVIREEDMSWLMGYLSSMFKSSLDNRRMKQNVYFNISVHGDLPNPNIIQTLLCTFSRSPYTCGVIHGRQTIAHV